MLKKMSKTLIVLLLFFVVGAFTIATVSADRMGKDGGNDWHARGWNNHDAGWFINNGWHDYHGVWYSDDYYVKHNWHFDDNNRNHYMHNDHWWMGRWQNDHWNDKRDR
jgi:hypothetical protein